MTAGHDQDGDARLLRRVRLRLVAWSGAITLAIVVILGVAVYLTVDQALSAAGHDQLSGPHRAPSRRSSRTPASDRATSARRFLGFATGGSSSGTYAIVIGPDDNVIGPVGEAAFPGLPVSAAVAAARGGTADYQELTLGVPIRMLTTPVTTSLGQTYVVQVIADRRGDVNTMQVLLIVLVGGRPARGGPVAGRRRAVRPARAGADPRVAAPPARVRGRRQPRAAHPAGRGARQPGAPATTPRPDGRHAARVGGRCAGHGRPHDRPGRVAAAAGARRLGRGRARTHPGGPGRRRGGGPRRPGHAGPPARGASRPRRRTRHAGGRPRTPAPAGHDPDRQRHPPQPAGHRRRGRGARPPAGRPS